MSVRSTVRRLLLLVLLLAAPRAASAVCTAQQIIATDPSCGASGPCTISGTYTVENGCTLDFGTRVVNLTGRLNIKSRSATIRAGTFTVAQGGLIDALGDAVDARGGTVVIETTGPFTSARSSRIDASGNTEGGDIIIRAGTTVTISGGMFADLLNAAAAGGLVDISANGNIVLTADSAVSARGGADSDGGGEIDLTAGGNLLVQTELHVDGSYGGFLELRANGTAMMADADASGGGDAGSGGCVDVTGGAGTTITGTIVADGVTGSFMTGGCGGFVCLDGDTGTTTLAATAHISASGASPDGGGGEISLVSLGSTVINGVIEVRGPTGDTCGGDVCVDTGLDATVGATGSVDVSGGDAGGSIEFIAGRDVTINGALDLSGRQRAALGGDVVLRAGDAGTGQLRVTSTIDSSTASSCSPIDGCGEAGSTDLSGCNVTVTNTGALIATGPDGGEHHVTAREQLTVQGVIDATHTVQDGSDGITRLEYPARKAPNLAGSNIAPAPVVQALATCPTQGPTTPPCLDPCPTCGNGQIEFPETCDNGALPPTSCGGCSVFCRIENCDDGLTCTGDQCFPTFGCRHGVTPMCTEPPTPTPTITGTRPTETSTPTPSSTHTNTATPTITATPNASPTGTATATPSPTASVTATPIASATSTGTASRTSTATATASPTTPSTATPIASATTTDTPTPNPTATASATAIDTATATGTATALRPACIGDCNGDDSVAINELISGVNIALGNSAVTTCPSFDRNADGSVTINELIAAVNAAQTGC